VTYFNYIFVLNTFLKDF